jgi:hypothetical protein
VAHIGIAPRERQSGSSVRGRPQICRTGIKELHKALYLPVVATTRFNPAMKAFYQRLLTRRKQKKVALIALLVIKWLHYLSKAGWSFSNMAVMLRLNLFTYRDLRGWLDEPYATPPLIPEPQQLKLGPCGNLDSLFNSNVQKKKETRFRTCPIWPPKTLHLLGQVLYFSLFWTAVET